MQHIDIPDAMDDATLLSIEEFCALARPATQATQKVYQHESRPRFWRFNGTGRLYTTAGEVRRSLAVAGTAPRR